MCERVSVGRHGTPGIVSDQETLDSLLIKPTDFSQDQISLALLTHAQEKGMSVLRGRAPSAEFKRLLSLRLKDTARQSFFGVAAIPCNEVRALRANKTDEKRDQGDRFFTVLDADTPELPNHAEIIVTRPNADPKITDRTAWKKERAELMKVFSSHVVLAANYRDGAALKQ